MVRDIRAACLQVCCIYIPLFFASSSLSRYCDKLMFVVKPLCNDLSAPKTALASTVSHRSHGTALVAHRDAKSTKAGMSRLAALGRIYFHSLESQAVSDEVREQHQANALRMEVCLCLVHWIHSHARCIYNDRAVRYLEPFPFSNVCNHFGKLCTSTNRLCATYPTVFTSDI